MNQKFVPEVEAVLREAGWYVGRKVSEEDLERWDMYHSLFPAARTALEEFGGLYIKERGYSFFDKEKGCLNSDNYRKSFCIDPVAACGYVVGNKDHDDFERYIGSKVYPIGLESLYTTKTQSGYIVLGRDTLLMDELGRVFHVDYAIGLVGDTIEHALSNLILGSGIHGCDPRIKSA